MTRNKWGSSMDDVGAVKAVYVPLPVYVVCKLAFDHNMKKKNKASHSQTHRDSHSVHSCPTSEQSQSTFCSKTTPSSSHPFSLVHIVSTEKKKYLNNYFYSSILCKLVIIK